MGGGSWQANVHRDEGGEVCTVQVGECKKTCTLHVYELTIVRKSF